MEWIKVISSLLLFLVPATTMATDVVGMIHVSGNDATIDGHSCRAVDVGYDGDRLATGGNSKAVVTGRGTVVSLASNTSVKLGAKALELIEGSVVVSSESGASTKVDNLTISTPPGVRARFLAKRGNDELQLLALEGKVDVSDGQQTQPVPAVRGLRVKLPKDKDSENSPRGAARWSWLHNDDIGILIVVAGAVAAGVAVGLINSENATPVSAH